MKWVFSDSTAKRCPNDHRCGHLLRRDCRICSLCGEAGLLVDYGADGLCGRRLLAGDWRHGLDGHLAGAEGIKDLT